MTSKEMEERVRAKFDYKKCYYGRDLQETKIQRNLAKGGG